MNKITLHGFNNLTKNLSFSLYKLHYLQDRTKQSDYNTYINRHFCAENLNTLLVKICHAIGGNVLNVAKQDYQPQGASVTLMISEEAQPESLVAHLDKSHICIHTYPEESAQDGMCIFRADIELSTCGVISPLKVLNYVIEDFNADVVDIDYRVRGMTRDSQGRKLYMDEQIINISDYLNSVLTAKFRITNHNLTEQNLFHCKLDKKEILLKDYLFQCNESDLTSLNQCDIKAQVEREIKELTTTSFILESRD